LQNLQNLQNRFFQNILSAFRFAPLISPGEVKHTTATPTSVHETSEAMPAHPNYASATGLLKSFGTKPSTLRSWADQGLVRVWRTPKLREPIKVTEPLPEFTHDIRIQRTHLNEFFLVIPRVNAIRNSENQAGVTGNVVAMDPGMLHKKLGGNKTFKCPHCNIVMGRDVNGARNVLLRYASGLGHIDARVRVEA